MSDFAYAVCRLPLKRHENPMRFIQICGIFWKFRFFFVTLRRFLALWHIRVRGRPRPLLKTICAGIRVRGRPRPLSVVGGQVRPPKTKNNKADMQFKDIIGQEEVKQRL
ncbi:MAG: hypothetical protein ACI4TV_05900, partial [Paludibacteraceae bacterium]